MDIPDSVINLVIGMVGGVAGGVVAGVFTLKATDKAIKDENEKEQRREEKEVQHMLGALGTEINALWSFHMRRIGNLIEQLPDGQPLEFYYPLTQDYFTIYHSNANMIGRIKDGSLAEAIVLCYNKCKKVVDGFKYNNDLFCDYKEMTNMPQGRVGDPQRIAAKHQEMIWPSPALSRKTISR